MSVFNYTKEVDKEGVIKVRVGKIIGHIILLLIILSFVTMGWGTVGAGERGVRFSKFTGVQEEVIGEGLYFKLPFFHKVTKINVRIQKNEVNASAASKDLQIVTSTIALNYHVSPDSAARLYQEVGLEYNTVIIAPSIQEAVKAVESQFTAEELIARREEVKVKIRDNLAERLLVRGIIVDEFNIINFKFSKSFDEAIEQKVTAQQLKLKADRDLERIKIEKEQMIISAQGKAEAIRIEAEALMANSDVIELRWIEKWNGNVPTYWGGATPFIGIGK